ncbi:hypothetical protein LTR86_001466 [Recurvomyces mirabilis]|nr:hypothetical protein LTR86_001466 [Recurvomyces mirabilis]
MTLPHTTPEASMGNIYTTYCVKGQLNQRSSGTEDRVQRWDWKDTKEEMYCRAPHTNHPQSKTSIPNVIHFISLTDPGEILDLDYARFLALKAAVVRAGAMEIKIHTTGLNQKNYWWKQLRRHVTLVSVDWQDYFPNGGSPVARGISLPHQADFLRLAILRREGGIYFDMDVYALKPLTELLDSPRDILMGHEGGNRYGLCNAVIIARPESEFLSRWRDAYTSFDPRVWNYHSVRLPKQMQVMHPDLICPLSPTVFFWPTWAKTHVHYMHDEVLVPFERSSFEADLEDFGGAMYENQLAFHAVAAKDYLNVLTADDVETVDTRFNLLLREVARADL